MCMCQGRIQGGGIGGPCPPPPPFKNVRKLRELCEPTLPAFMLLTKSQKPPDVMIEHLVLKKNYGGVPPVPPRLLHCPLLNAILDPPLCVYTCTNSVCTGHLCAYVCCMYICVHIKSVP